MSLRGISIYKEGESEFTTVSKLSKEIENFRKIKKIEFFARYVIEKAFKQWKIKTIRKKFEGQCKTVSKKVLSQNIVIQGYLQFLFNHVEDFNKCKFLDVYISTTSTLDHLATQLKAKENAIEKSLEYFEHRIESTLKATIEDCLYQFRQERPNAKPDGKEGSDELYLPYDTAKRPMKYTQIAKLKEFEESMYRLLKMTDLVRLNTKILMVMGGLENYAAELSLMHDKYLNRKEVNVVSWVTIKLIIDKQPRSETECS